MATGPISSTARAVVALVLAATLAAAGVNTASAEPAPAPVGAAATPTAIVAGYWHTCALLEDATVKCWGANAGRLGLGDGDLRGDGPGEMGANLAPVDLGPGRTAVAVAAGFSQTCAVLDNATVKCWGQNQFGELGQGDTAARGEGPGEMGANLVPVDLGPGRTAVAVTAGELHTCAVLDDATVKCWGENSFGQLGQGDTAARGDGPGEMGANLAPVDLGPGRTATALTADIFHTCALLDNATVKCWGANGYGQLGLGDTVGRGDEPGEMGANLAPVDLGPGRTATAITTGHGFTCALLDNSTVKCWGLNEAGELGQGNQSNRGDNPAEMGAGLAPVDLGPGRTAAAVSAGTDYACALLDNATVKCWGWNLDGQLGQGDTTDRGDNAGEMGANLAPVDLGPGRTATAITTGYGQACAVLDNATVKCWGSNEQGQLGQGDTEDRGDESGEMGANLAPVDLGDANVELPIVTPGVGIANPEGNTGSQFINVPVTLSAPSPATVTVDWTTLDIPTSPTVAHPGSDYVFASGTVIFPPGETSQNVQIEVLGDIVDEPPALYGEWGLIQLSNPSSATLSTGGLFGLGLFVIVDDDPPPLVKAGGVVVSPEGDTGSTVWNLPVTLSAPSASVVTVDWTTLDVPATPTIAHPGSDYVFASGTATFTPGQTSQNVQIVVLGDTVDEPPAYYGEWGLVALSNPTNATVDTGGLYGLGLFIIIDDD